MPLVIPHGCARLADVVITGRVSPLGHRGPAGRFCLFRSAFALSDDRARLFDVGHALGIERCHELTQPGCFDMVDAPSEAVDAAITIEDHVFTAITTSERVPAL